MKLTVEHEELARVLSHVQGIVDRKSHNPILANVLLNVQDGTLSVTATNRIITIADKVPAAVEEPGTITVPVHTFYDIVRKLPSGKPIKLSLPDGANRISISAGRSVFKLSTLPADEFTNMPEVELPHSFTISSKELRDLLNHTRFAMASDFARPNLNGILFQVTVDAGEDVLRSVATDGHRLAMFQVPAPAGSKDIPDTIVSSKTIAEVVKLAEEITVPVIVELSAGRIKFTFGSTTLSSTLVDGKYPDYARVIPVDNDKELEVNSQDFSEAVDRVAVISTEDSRTVKFVIADNSINLSIGDQADSSADDVDAVYSDDSIRIGFNSAYLLDVTQQIDGKTLTMKLKDEKSAALLYDASNPAGTYVVMPVKV